MADYKDTLRLPQTDFSMRANLPAREPDAIAAWERDAVYAQMIARRQAQGGQPFLLHDGPPYANGNLHHGHILNKTLKDFVVKYRASTGRVCHYVPGWDCHGLPIEHQVDKNLGAKKHEMTKVQIRKACREYAQEFVAIQRDEFKRAMVFGQWDDPYLTMDYGYEAKTVRELGRIFERGLAYRGLRCIHWDWAAQTALAEAEVEYAAFTTEHVYVKFPFAQLPADLAAKVGALPTFVVIWTTTPWTLPANLAIALHPELDYQLVQVGQEVYVMAEALREEALKSCKIDPATATVLATFPGRALVGELEQGLGLVARHPFIERDSVLLPADYVTTEQGTGCVHTAPGHGQDDFALGKRFGLDVLCPVDNQGRFIGAQVPEYAGQQVFSANPAIVQRLHDAGLLLNHPGDKVRIERYPHGWRSKKPIIFRATTQWFVAMEPETVGLSGDDALRLRDRCLEIIDQDVQWLPRWGRDRIHGMMINRPDWCISRQRSWGVPITALHCNACDHALATRELADHVADLVEVHGVDVWFEREPLELAPEGTQCPACGSTDFRKEEDILDVWFDSGVSWSAVLESKLGLGDQADLYLEGSDQHRGWFQSSLLCGILSRDHAPYKTCLTHGFVTDENGHKYSKSSKNFEPPQKMIDTYGAEILRLWVAAVDYRGDITLSKEILQRVADSYRKIRNTFRFLLGNLDGFNPDTDMLPLDKLDPVDRYVLHRTGDTIARVQQAFEEYQFHSIYHALVQLATVDLSNLYMDVTKDRMYCEGADSPARRSAQTAYWLILDALLRSSSPILSFTAQEAWEMMPRRADAPQYVFHADFPAEATAWQELADPSHWAPLLEAREVVQRALEARRGPKKDKLPGQIGSSQEAHVTLTAPQGPLLTLLQEVGEQALATLFIVSHVVLREGVVEGSEQGLHVEVTPAADLGHRRCERCWNYWIAPPAADTVELCDRCAGVLDAR